MKPPIFIIGPNRSGSTLWHNIVAMHNNVLRLSEPRFLSTRNHKDFRHFLRSQNLDIRKNSVINKMVNITLSRKETPGLEGAFWQFNRYTNAELEKLGHSIKTELHNSDKSLGSIFRIYIEEATKIKRSVRACVKFPVDVKYTKKLLQWFPNCKIIHIMRDPRGLAMSKTNDPSGTAKKIQKHPSLSFLIRKSYIAFSIREYRRHSKHYSILKNHPNYQLFQYEDLLIDPEKTVRALCAFIDETYTDKMINLESSSFPSQRSSITGKRKKSIDPKAAVRWKDTMPKFDQSMTELFTRRSMQRFGYNPTTHPIFQVEYQD